MKLETKTRLVIFICLFLVAGSIVQYRWLSLNDVQITQGMVDVEANLQALRSLKKNIDQFNVAATRLGNDEKLSEIYYDEKIAYHNELGRVGVEKMDEVLKMLYLRDAFFELTHLSLKHQDLPSSGVPREIKFLVEGNRRLIKQ